ncbi:MAG: ABC transporter permease [Chloroflexota bacterium]|nr:ABC transporter permease [Chloroflexota bacterium]
MRHLSHIWFIALKDLKIFVTDRLALGFALLFPFLFIVLFSLMPAGADEDSRLEIHLATQEAEGGISHDIIGAMETIDESQLAPGEPKIIWDRDYAEALRAVEDGDIGGFLAFPEDFSEGVMMGYGADLEVVADAEAANTRAVLNGIATAIASEVGAQQVASSATIGLMVEQSMIGTSDMPDIEQAMRQIFAGMGNTAAGESVIAFETQKIGEVEGFNGSNYVIPGYLVMFVFFTAALAAELIVRERQNHTLERMLASSVRKESILGGMFAGTAAKGLIQIILFWVVGLLAFNVDLGLSPAAVIVLSLLMVIMSSAFAIMLATLAKTQRSASSLAVLLALVLAPLGGCWWPLFITPKWMQFIGKLTPHGWATTGFNKLMLFGAEFGDVLPEMLVLVGFTVAFGMIAVWRFRTSAV